MFSYRHAFHAGNHADVLKHVTWIALLQYLTQKESPLTVIDTHAGAGIYRLDGDYATTSGESRAGILRLLSHATQNETIQAYRALIATFNSGNRLAQDTKTYPGSPFLAHQLLRPCDKLWAHELHPKDYLLLEKNAQQLPFSQRMLVRNEDGFTALRALLPPPKSQTGSRRALILIDPSYEMKTDYAKVEAAISDGLMRFATGCYVVWYPIIPRPEAHALPRRLKALATQAGRTFLHATLHVGGEHRLDLDAVGFKDVSERQREGAGSGLTASGMCIINPPYTLKQTLQAALPEVLRCLARPSGERMPKDGQGFTVE